MFFYEKDDTRIKYRPLGRAPTNLLMIINNLNDMKIVYRPLGRAPTNLAMIIEKTVGARPSERFQKRSGVIYE